MKLTAASHQSADSQDKPIVLVADDSRVMRVALTRILKDSYTVLEAEHGEEAWAKLTAEPGVQMVFSDLSMPELDGFGLLDRIRGSEQARIREVPFIVITGNEDDQKVRERAMAGGATDFVLKPFQSVEIKARAKAHVDHLRKLGAVSEELEQKTVQDDTTGLANRRHFDQRAEQALALATRQQLPVAVLQVQLDRYQSLRHERGEDAANQALASVAEALRARTRAEDVLAHFGEGLFGLLTMAADQVGAAQLAGRMAEGVAAAGADLTVSVGIAASLPGAGTTVADLLERSERLVAKAVRKGGNTVVAEDYVQAQPQAAAPAARAHDDAALVQLREQLQARERALEQQREQSDAQSGELTQARQELRDLRAELDAARAELRQEQEARKQAETEAQRLAQEVERANAESENLRYGASNAESERAELQHTIDALRAQLEESSSELDDHRQRLANELSNRQAVESELARLKLQDVARREADQKAAEQPSARVGLAGRLRILLGGKRSSG